MRPTPPLTLHIPKEHLSGFYEAGWAVFGDSDIPDHLQIAWKRLRAPVVPYSIVANVFELREYGRRVELQAKLALEAAE